MKFFVGQSTDATESIWSQWKQEKVVRIPGSSEERATLLGTGDAEIRFVDVDGTSFSVPDMTTFIPIKEDVVSIMTRRDSSWTKVAETDPLWSTRDHLIWKTDPVVFSALDGLRLVFPDGSFVEPEGAFCLIRYPIMEQTRQRCLARKRHLDSIRHDKDQMLRQIHQDFQLSHGSFFEELPEQIMSILFIDPLSKVLEIGGNIGRNSLVIASVLHDDQNLVVLESHPEIVKQLHWNRDQNGFQFHVVNAALSKKRLIQNHWATKASDTDEVGWIEVATIDYVGLKKAHPIEFDTLVLDCEGAFYFILQDFPEILNNITTIALENDFVEDDHKRAVDEILKGQNFQLVYNQPLGPVSWFSPFLCQHFFQVWKKK